MSQSAVQFLSTVPLFSGLEGAELEALADVTRERTFPKGSVILFEKDPGDSLFIMRSGRVKVVLAAEDGREVILATLGVGEHFGELALIDDRPRSASVMAMEDSTMIVLHRHDFRRRVESSPSLAWSLLTELSGRLRRADEKIGGLILLDVPGRIAKLLVDSAADPERTMVARPLTHQTMAQMIGASRETVSRAMKDFQDAGWIKVTRRQIELADRTALEQRARMRV